jgi:hypothetical protein
MDMMSMVSGILAMQAGGLQSIQTSIIKSNSDAEKFAVQTLLGAPSTANQSPGVGGVVNLVA